jgi:hypothetical protein
VLVETGQVEVTHEPVQVQFSQAFNDPVVVAGPATFNDIDPGVLVVDNITATGFELRFREWDYLDDIHGRELVSYVVVERGTTVLPSGAIVQAGTVELANGWVTVPFEETYSAAPTLLATIASQKSSQTVAPRITSLGTGSFRTRYTLEENTSTLDQLEQLNWIAWPTGSHGGADDQFAWESDSFLTDENFSSYEFTETYLSPCAIASVNTLLPNPATLRYQQNQTASFEVLLLEEQSRDPELLMGNEGVGVLVTECGQVEQSPPVWDPAALIEVDSGLTEASVSWGPGATDTSGAVYYKIYLDGVLVETTVSTSYQVVDLMPDSSYIVEIVAVDRAGNEVSLADAIATESVADDSSAPVWFTRADKLFGPWVESRHRNDDVFNRFSASQIHVSVDNVLDILSDARATNTKLFMQLGHAGEWGWDFATNTSSFTLEKWKASVSGFGENPVLRSAIDEALTDGTIRGIYMIDEPHHKKWSPSGNSNHHIPNSDIDEMARFVKSYWPQARTSVRASASVLLSSNRSFDGWQYLDESFLMIHYNRWSRPANYGTIESFMEGELKVYAEQGLDYVGSIQTLTGAPLSETIWWPDANVGGATPLERMLISPVEIRAYVDAFSETRNGEGQIDPSGDLKTDAIMLFRWDRNDEVEWQNPFYDEVITQIVEATSDPASISVEWSAGNDLILNWAPGAIDDTGLARYEVFINGDLVAVSNETNYTLNGINPDLSYDIEIVAIDFNDNNSSVSRMLGEP